jgi:hypothetical protein
MKKFIIGAIAAVVLGLGFTASNASAYWANRTVYRWDPALAAYVPVVQRVWVPDYTYYGGPVYSYYRPWYAPYYFGHGRHEWREHHEHHEHHHH